MKTIYEFEIKKEVEVEKVETRKEGEQTISVATKVKEVRPTYFALKRPNRSERDEADLTRAKAFRFFVEAGVITQAALRKKYGNSVGLADNGGVYTNEEEQYYANLRLKMRDNLEQYTKLSASEVEEDKKKADKIFEELFTIREQIISFEESVEAFYRDTAEAKARNKLIEYYICQLTHWRKNTDEEWKPFFNGKSFEERYQDMVKKEDDEDTDFAAILDKVTFVIMILLSRPDISREEIKELETQV